MLKIKEYADSKGISTQVVYKHIKKREKEFEGHIIKRNSIQYLDDEAVTLLNSIVRENTLFVVDTSKDDEIKRLQEEINRLRQRNEYLSDRLLEQSDREKDAIIKLTELSTKVILLESQKKKRWWKPFS